MKEAFVYIPIWPSYVTALCCWFSSWFHSFFEGDPESSGNVRLNVISKFLINGCSNEMVIKVNCTFPTALVCFLSFLFVQLCLIIALCDGC